MPEYRCTRNAPYLHECAGYFDLRERQGYYLIAVSPEEAYQKMLERFPSEVNVGFTVQEWVKEKSVTIWEIKRDSEGNTVGYRPCSQDF
jgi:hypothetical protein